MDEQIYVAAFTRGVRKISLSKSPEKSLRKLAPQSGQLVVGECIFRVDQFGYKVEKAVHDRLASKRIYDDLFEVTEQDAVEAIQFELYCHGYSAEKQPFPPLPHVVTKMCCTTMEDVLVVKAAKALSGLTWPELQKLAGVDRGAVNRLQTQNPDHRSVAQADINKIKAALSRAGVEFIPENGGGAGVRLRKGTTE